MSDYLERIERYSREKFEERERKEQFRKNAIPYIERGMGFYDFARDFDVKPEHEELFNSIAAEMKREQELDAVFLQAFNSWDTPIQQKNTKTVVS